MALEGSIEELKRIYTFCREHYRVHHVAAPLDYLESELSISGSIINHYMNYLAEQGIIKIEHRAKPGLGPYREIPAYKVIKEMPSLDILLECTESATQVAA